MKGFTLVELLVVISIVSILAAVVILIVNPLELMKRGRDVTRIKDLDNLTHHIGTRVTNGSGWIKANLTSQTSVTLSTLPIIRT